MGGQWLRRRGEKEQKGIGDDRLEKTVSGRYRGREAKRGYWRTSDINLKTLQVAREETDNKGYPTVKKKKGKEKNQEKYKTACNIPASKFVDWNEREKQNG